MKRIMGLVFSKQTNKAKLVPPSSLDTLSLQRLFQYSKNFTLAFESISGGVYIDNNCFFALKVFSDNKTDRYLYETEIAAYKKFEELEFNFVPKVIECNSVKNHGSFILMENCGRDLCDIGKIQYQSWARIVEFLIDCLDLMHKNGIAHGDIKSENIMMNSIGELKIIDLGFTSQGQKKNGIGTLPFVTPYNRDTKQNDKYAAALTLIELAGFYHDDVEACCLYTRNLCAACESRSTLQRYARIDIQKLLSIKRPKLVTDLVNVACTQLDINHEFIIWDRKNNRFHYGNKIHENREKKITCIENAWNELKISISNKTSDVE